jgi:hypothetical protein
MACSAFFQAVLALVMKTLTLSLAWFFPDFEYKIKYLSTINSKAKKLDLNSPKLIKEYQISDLIASK